METFLSLDPQIFLAGVVLCGVFLMIVFPLLFFWKLKISQNNNSIEERDAEKGRNYSAFVLLGGLILTFIASWFIYSQYGLSFPTFVLILYNVVPVGVVATIFFYLMVRIILKP